MRYVLPLLLVALGAAAAEAQQAPAPAADPVMTALRSQYNSAKRNIVASAEQMPEEAYGFKPIDTVRSFGELVGHVVNAQYSYCASASGMARPADTQGRNFEQVSAKAELVAALKASFEFCDQAYQMTDAKAAELVTAGNSQRPRLSGLVGNLVHIWEHYGNFATYMRMKGLVPPSSQRG